MKAYFRWYNWVYDIVNPNTKRGKAFIDEFEQKSKYRRITLSQCYVNPSFSKENAYMKLMDSFHFTTITSFNTFRFTAMSKIEGLDALFINTGVNCYVVAERAELKQFADDLQVGFCEYREGK